MSFRLIVSGPIACFRRLEIKNDLVTYDVISVPAAARIFEAIHWSEGMRWRIETIIVLNPIQHGWVTLPAGDGFAEKRGHVLKDVSYALKARFKLDDVASDQGGEAQHAAIFGRRARQGRFARTPFLGLRGLSANVKFVEKSEDLPVSALAGNPEPVDLGWMIYDKNPDGPGTRFFRPLMMGGQIDIPPPGVVETAR